jgi:hypothetical protein
MYRGSHGCAPAQPTTECAVTDAVFGFGFLHCVVTDREIW